jgi:hypothetical protein
MRRSGLPAQIERRACRLQFGNQLRIRVGAAACLISQ